MHSLRGIRVGALGWSLLLLITILPLQEKARGAPFSGIDPALIEQAKRMTPAQREALARQYGIDLEAQEASIQSSTRRMQPAPKPLQKPKASNEVKSAKASDKDRGQNALERFGPRLFQVEGAMFAPPSSSAVPQDYLLEPGDILRVTLFGKITAQYEVAVERDGSFVLPDLGSIPVAGLSLLELKALTKLIAEERLIGTELYVSPVELRQINVMVVGEVKKPGSYTLSAQSSPLHALYLSGGPTEIGSYRNIKLTSVSGVVERLDLYALLMGGQLIKTSLKDGDIIYVPPFSNEVAVEGEVVRPARYEIEPGTTIESLLQMAGGPTPRAYSKGMSLNRYDPSVGTPSVLQVDSFSSSMVLLNGDRLTVRSGSDQPNNAVKISGAMAQPGVYEFKKGLRVSDYLPSLEANYLQQADLEQGLIVRRLGPNQDIEVLTFSPIAAADGAPSAANPLLEPYDELLVLPVALKRSNREKQNNPVVVRQDPEAEEQLENTGQSAELREIEQSLNQKVDGVTEVAIDVGKNTSGQRNSGRLDPESLSRRSFIDPIVAKLRNQAKPGRPAQIVSVYGAVSDPGDYPLVGGDDSVNDLLTLAGGVLDGAYLGNVEVRRRVVTGSYVKNLILNFDLLSPGAFALQAADELRINFLPGWRERETAIINGEVEFPGEYVLTPGETISSLIERAGGFTDEAFVEALRFRSADAKQQQQSAVNRGLIQARKSAALINQRPTDFGEEVFAIEVEGRVVVDVPRILAGDLSADVAVQGGDEIFVPRVSEVVYLVGDVLEPGNYRHIEGTTLEQYIDMAAGYTATAKTKDVYFILPNGRVQRANQRKSLFSFRQPSFEIVAGTTIVVPPNLAYAKPLDYYSQVSSVVFQSMASIAAFFSLAKN